uniref:Uncharacterized protein n=1 Tax=Elaeophora elaphi TaxID=1147741 RepID=A0A0R3RKM8_9BILA
MKKNLNLEIEISPTIPTDQIQQRNNLRGEKIKDEATPLASESTEEDIVTEVSKKRESSKENKMNLISESPQRCKVESSQQNKRISNIDSTQRSISQKAISAEIRKGRMMTENTIVKPKQGKNTVTDLSTDSSQASDPNSTHSWFKNESDKTEIKTVREIPLNKLKKINECVRSICIHDMIRLERNKSQAAVNTASSRFNISITGDEEAQSFNDSGKTKRE